MNAQNDPQVNSQQDDDRVTVWWLLRTLILCGVGTGFLVVCINGWNEHEKQFIRSLPDPDASSPSDMIPLGDTGKSVSRQNLQKYANENNISLFEAKRQLTMAVSLDMAVKDMKRHPENYDIK
jgi:hypothetical protein